MVGRVPVLGRVDPREWEREQGIDRRHDRGSTVHGKFARTEVREPTLGVNDEQ
jgi:hypothetical protein